MDFCVWCIDFCFFKFVLSFSFCVLVFVIGVFEIVGEIVFVGFIWGFLILCKNVIFVFDVCCVIIFLMIEGIV